MYFLYFELKILAYYKFSEFISHIAQIKNFFLDHSEIIKLFNFAFLKLVLVLLPVFLKLL